MPYIKTKYSEIKVELDDEVQLVVPGKFATPTICSRQNLYSIAFRLKSWDPVEHKIRIKDFHTLAAAEENIESVNLTPELCLRKVRVHEILAKAEYFQKHYRLAPQSMDYDHVDVPLDPRYFGMHLGDGNTSNCTYTTADKELLEYVISVADSFNLEVVPMSKYVYRISRKNNEGRFANAARTANRDNIIAALTDWAAGMRTADVCKKYTTTLGTLKKYKAILDAGNIDEYYALHQSNPIQQRLKDLGVIGNKHIPEIYLKNSRNVRLNILAGLIDTDGSLNCGGYTMCFANKRLIDDVVILARSLGFTCPDVKEITSVCTNAAGGPKDCVAYRTRISGGNELREIPLLLPHKRITADKTQRYDQLRFEITA